MSRSISRFILPEFSVDDKILQVMDDLCSISYAVGGARHAPEGITPAKSKRVDDLGGRGSLYAVVLNKEDRRVSGLHRAELPPPKNSGRIEVPLWVGDSNCVSLILSHICPDRRSQKGLRAAAVAYEIIRVYWRGDDEPELLAGVKDNTIAQQAGRLAGKADDFALDSYLMVYSDVELLGDPGKTMLDAWESALGWRPQPLPFDEIIEDHAKYLDETQLEQFGAWVKSVKKEEEELGDGQHYMNPLELWYNFSQMADRLLAAPKPSEKDMALLMRELKAREELSLHCAQNLPPKERKKILRYWNARRIARQGISHVSDVISTL